jgi:hypothetical protein
MAIPLQHAARAGVRVGAKVTTSGAQRGAHDGYAHGGVAAGASGFREVRTDAAEFAISTSLEGGVVRWVPTLE